MSLTKIVVTSVLDTSTAFAATLSNPIEAVFVPGSVSSSVDLQVGEEVYARLVPNTYKPDRTPWMAVRIERNPGIETIQPAPGWDHVRKLSIADRVRKVLKDGGVWTADMLYSHLFPSLPSLPADTGTQGQVEVAATLRSMFNRGECSKFQLWSRSGDAEPEYEWFTCYPEKADVDEWED